MKATEPFENNNNADSGREAADLGREVAASSKEAADLGRDTRLRGARTQGTLYLCATPIGNLGDITERVLRTLEEVDLIAAEDTRNTLRLLNHFGIKKPLTSYHEYNKYTKADELIGKLRSGQNIAVVTDAGTPARCEVHRAGDQSDLTAWRLCSDHSAHHVRHACQKVLL